MIDIQAHGYLQEITQEDNFFSPHFFYLKKSSRCFSTDVPITPQGSPIIKRLTLHFYHDAAI